MSVNQFTRARLVGLVMVVVAFGSGVAVGHLLTRQPAQGLMVTMTATDAIPGELQSLGLSESQQQQIRNIIRAGRPRVMSVLEAMEPQMRDALQTTEREIEGVLSADQLARWKEFRRLNPLRTERRFIER